MDWENPFLVVTDERGLPTQSQQECASSFLVSAIGHAGGLRIRGRGAFSVLPDQTSQDERVISNTVVSRAGGTERNRSLENLFLVLELACTVRECRQQTHETFSFIVGSPQEVQRSRLKRFPGRCTSRVRTQPSPPPPADSLNPPAGEWWFCNSLPQPSPTSSKTTSQVIATNIRRCTRSDMSEGSFSERPAVRSASTTVTTTVTENIVALSCLRRLGRTSAPALCCP